MSPFDHCRDIIALWTNPPTGTKFFNRNRWRMMVRLAFVLLMSQMSGNVAFAVEKLAQEKMTQGKLNRDYVVILHGIARSSNHMEALAEYLEKQDYDVVNLDYPSTSYTLEKLVNLIQDDVAKKLIEEKNVHFIGYSMGGLLVRAILHKHRPKNLGRVIQLAPPNHGSEIADFLKDYWVYRKIYGPAGQQLITDQEKIKHLFGEVDYELGVIAGNSTIDPISSMIIPGDDDGKVSIQSTKLKGMKDHVVVSATHTFFPSNKTVHRQTEYFLKHGVFKKELGGS